MTAEVRLRTLASLDAGLQALLGDPFRFYDTTLKQKSLFPAVVFQRVSTARRYSHSGLDAISMVRLQFSIYDPDAETTRAVAQALIAFMATYNGASEDQTDSPPKTPKQFPNFLLNQWTGVNTVLLPPVFTQILDFRVYSLEE